MSNFDILELCFRNLFRRKTRTILAVSGVIIGTCAIVVMLSIGFGLADSFQAQIEGWGNLRMIEVWSGRMGMQTPGSGDNGVINDRTIAEMEKIKGVVAVTPVAREHLMVGIGRMVTGLEVMGVRPEVLEKFNFDVQEGRLLRETDRNTILFGNQTPYFFYDPNRPVWTGNPIDVMKDRIILTDDWNLGRRPTGGAGGGGQQQTFSEFRVRGIGVLANPNDDTAYRAYMRLDDLLRIQAEIRRNRGERVVSGPTRTYDQALVYVESIGDSASVTRELRNMEFQTWSPSDWLESMRQTARMIQGVLGGIGGISLLVAALGITNTMIMSIYERTKEIGVMKVIGANLRDIRKLFMLEAGMIGFIGGLIGVLLSLLLSFLMNTVLKDIISVALWQFGGGFGGAISVIPWWVTIAALAFSTVIGMAAGFYPARRAMNLSALESLRNE